LKQSVQVVWASLFVLSETGVRFWALTDKNKLTLGSL
jgi:hypothetical protein